MTEGPIAKAFVNREVASGLAREIVRENERMHHQGIPDTEWCKKYRQIINPRTGTNFFEAYDDADARFVAAVDEHHVWTECDDMDGKPITVAGRRRMNRNGWSITLEPWTDPNEWSFDPDYPVDEDEDEEPEDAA